MKQGILVVMLLVLVAGGYFVGTKMFEGKKPVTENQEKKQDDHLVEEKKVPRTVKVNGTLYYDTGRLSTIEGRCGTPDGYIHSTVLPNETPESDNESNFGRYGYQYVDENTIEVDLPTGWTVFSSDEKEAALDVLKNYVTIQNGKIDNQQLIDEFLEKIENQYDASLTFLNYNDDTTAQYYYLNYHSTPTCLFDHKYTLIVDAFQEEENPKYLYSFKSLDTTNGMTLKEYAYVGIIEFADNTIQMNAEEFIIY